MSGFRGSLRPKVLATLVALLGACRSLSERTYVSDAADEEARMQAKEARESAGMAQLTASLVSLVVNGSCVNGQR